MQKGKVFGDIKNTFSKRIVSGNDICLVFAEGDRPFCKANIPKIFDISK